MEVIDNNALLVNTKFPTRITDTIKKSSYLGEVGGGVHQVLVHWSLPAAQTLRALKYKGVPSPIIKEYNWPGFYKPMAHQKTTSEFLTLHKKSFCFSEAGVGKTGSAIWAADYLMMKGVIRRALIICPLSVMQSAWESELFKLCMHRKVAIAYGMAEKRKQLVQGDEDFVVINYDGVEIVLDELKKNGKFDLVILDEGNAIKSTSTKRWKTINKLITPDTWVWLMTGTPAAQSPVDAYGLAKIVRPDATPRFFGAYRDSVMVKYGMFRWEPRPNAEKIVHNLLQPAIRFTKDECLDLPDVVHQMRDVEITTQQKKYYNLLKQRMTMTAAAEEITAVNAAVLMNKLLQISAGSVYSDNKETVNFDASARLKVLDEVIEEASHKILIYANFTHSIDQIYEHLKKRYQVAIIDGRTTGAQRHKIIQRFQTTASPHILILQPQAAAHGITLTAANVVVWFSPVMSLENYLQANARIHRQGQINKMTVVHIQGSPVERRIYSMLLGRLDVHSKLVELFKDETA